MFIWTWRLIHHIVLIGHGKIKSSQITSLLCTGKRILSQTVTTEEQEQQKYLAKIFIFKVSNTSSNCLWFNNCYLRQMPKSPIAILSSRCRITVSVTRLGYSSKVFATNKWSPNTRQLFGLFIKMPLIK